MPPTPRVASQGVISKLKAWRRMMSAAGTNQKTRMSVLVSVVIWMPVALRRIECCSSTMLTREMAKAIEMTNRIRMVCENP
jgi:hypothetical protein